MKVQKYSGVRSDPNPIGPPQQPAGPSGPNGTPLGPQGPAGNFVQIQHRVSHCMLTLCTCCLAHTLLTQGLQAGHDVGFMMYWWSRTIVYSQQSLTNVSLCAVVALGLHRMCLHKCVACFALQIAKHMSSDRASNCRGCKQSQRGGWERHWGGQGARCYRSSCSGNTLSVLLGMPCPLFLSPCPLLFPCD